MATFDSDFIRVRLDIGAYDIPCYKIGFEWPPPKHLFLTSNGQFREALPRDDKAFVLFKRNMSALPDDVAGHPNIARGAEYVYEREPGK